jgi:hypothetical protein
MDLLAGRRPRKNSTNSASTKSNEENLVDVADKDQWGEEEPISRKSVTSHASSDYVCQRSEAGHTRYLNVHTHHRACFERCVWILTLLPLRGDPHCTAYRHARRCDGVSCTPTGRPPDLIYFWPAHTSQPIESRPWSRLCSVAVHLGGKRYEATLDWSDLEVRNESFQGGQHCIVYFI